MLWGTIRNRETFERSSDLFEKAIGEDPSYGEPHAGLAMAQVLNWQFHWTDDWNHSLEKAERHLDLALRISPQIAFVHHVAAVFYSSEKGLLTDRRQRRMSLEPQSELRSGAQFARHRQYDGGQPLAAVPHIEQAIRLDPAIKQLYIHFLGSAYQSPAITKPPRPFSGSVSNLLRRQISRAPFLLSRSAIWVRPRKLAGSGAS